MYNRYGYIQLNFKNPEIFKFKFDRDPKSWSLEQIQDLWEKSENRAKERQTIISNVYDKIIDEIPKNSNNKKVVYFTKGEVVYQYEFSYNSDFKSWGYSTSRVDFSNNKVVCRDEKIEFILSNSRAFELGEEFESAQKYKSKIHFRVKSIFIDLISDNLKKVYKDKFPPDITMVSVGDKKYYFAVDDQHRYNYHVFHYKGLVTDKVIEL